MYIHQTPVPRWFVSDVYLWGLDSLRRPVSLTRIEVDSQDDLAMYCYEIPEYLFVNSEIFYVVPEVVL